MSVSEIGQAVKNRRKTLGITQPHLAELAGISVNTPYKIERGEAIPTLEVMAKLADVPGMELSLTLTWKNFSAKSASGSSFLSCCSF